MLREKFMASLLLVPFGLITACAQPEAASPEDAKTAKEVAKTKKASAHPFGGWYCPDNLRGFPPVNIAELNKVPVVNGRMPTKEETQNGTSLMYFDPWEYPTAKPLDMNLPRLARYFTESTQQYELAIIIQAVVVDEDTILGLRYVDGGNASCWYNEVEILTNNEVAAIGATPFVFLKADINATKQEIWKAITQTDYAKNIAERFDKKAFFEADWTNHSMAKLNYEVVGESAKGIIFNNFGAVYLQIDYDYNGRQAVEKIMVFEDPESGMSHIQLVFGPYTKGDTNAQARWEKWLEEVKMMSEKS